MADETHDTPANENKPAPRRRPPRKTANRAEGAAKPAAKRASRPSTAAPKPAAKKAASPKSATKPSTKPRAAKKPDTATDRARAGLNKAAEGVGGKRNVGLIAGGLAVAGAAAAALLSLRSSTPKKGGKNPALKAHQPDGKDSSEQMDALIADENMVPEAPKA